MTVGDNVCDGCKSKEAFPYRGTVGGYRICLCRRCAGAVAQALFRYIKGFDRDHPRPRPAPRNQAAARVDMFGTARCRSCEVALHDWKRGDSPYCDECRPGGVTP